MHISIHRFEVFIIFDGFICFFSSSIWNLDRDPWTWIWLFFFCFFCFIFSFSFPFVILLMLQKNLFSKMWVVNVIILGCLPFFVPPTRWTLSKCFMNFPLSLNAPTPTVHPLAKGGGGLKKYGYKGYILRAEGVLNSQRGRWELNS